MAEPLEIWETPDGQYRWEIYGWVEWPGRDDKQARCVLTVPGGHLSGLVWYSEITAAGVRTLITLLAQYG